MITVVDGDLMDSTEDIIAHSVNCMGVMGSGVALAIRNKYPDVYKSYKSLCDTVRCEALLSQVQICKTTDGKRVANLFGQLRYGTDIRHTDYEVLGKTFHILASIAAPADLSIAMPYGIGCGRGGGDWAIVYPMIEKEFANCNVTLYRYKEKI